MSLPFDGLNHDRKTALPALAVSIEVVTTVLLFMRIGSRFTAGHSTIGVDDVLIFLAWITGLGLTIAVLLGAFQDLNRQFTSNVLQALRSMVSIDMYGMFHWSNSPGADWFIALFLLCTHALIFYLDGLHC